MRNWAGILFNQGGEGDQRETPDESSTPSTEGSSESTPFPRLNIPVLDKPPRAVRQTEEPPSVEEAGSPNEATTVDDPHLMEVIEQIRARVETMAGTAFRQFNSVRKRMQQAKGPGEELDLALVCAAIDVSGQELAREVRVMEESIQTAELEVGNEIDAREREAVSDLEANIRELESSTSLRQTEISDLEERLLALRGKQSEDQRTLALRQAELRTQQVNFTASRRRLRAARVSVGKELANQRRMFLEL